MSKRPAPTPVDRLVDRLVQSGLPPETVESFRRVTATVETKKGLPRRSRLSRNKASGTRSPNDDDDDDDNDDGVKLVLRSGGEPLTLTLMEPIDADVARRNLPSFVVCLAHHGPTDIFTLFAFTMNSIPCRLARFNRDGKKITKGRDDITNEIMKPYLWNVADAKVLVAAVEQCEGYFDTTGSRSGSGADVNAEDGARSNTDDYSADERAKFLRLTPQRMSAGIDDKEHGERGESESLAKKSAADKDAEALAIRTLILTKLLINNTSMDDHENDGHGLSESKSSLVFHHPDPNFLMPLSKALAAELKRWRELCRNVPPTEVWPGLPQGIDEAKGANGSNVADDKDMVETATEEDTLCGNIGTKERDLLDEIITKRKTQIEQSGKVVRKALERMQCLLVNVGEGGTDIIEAAMEIGRGRVSTLLSLVKLQRKHWDDWYSCNEALGEICEMQADDYEKTMDGITTSLIDWHSDGNLEIHEDIMMEENEDEKKREEKNDDIDDTARIIINKWKRDDTRILSLLHSAFAVVEDAIKSGNAVAKNESVYQIQAISRKLDMEEKSVHSKNFKNVARLAKLWFTPDTDDEEESDDDDHPWLENGTTPRWTEDQQEACTSFSWFVKATPLLFLVDQAGVADLMLYRMERVYCDYYNHDCYSEQEDDRFERRWQQLIAPCFNFILIAIPEFSLADDPCNASLLLISCCRFLCDLLKGRFDHADWSKDADKIVLNNLREMTDKFDLCAIKIAFKYFEDKESKETMRASSLRVWAHWYYDVLKSGMISFPIEIVNIENRRKMKGRMTDSRAGHCWWNLAWWNASHQAAAIFSHRGWLHPDLCQVLSEDTKPEKVKQWIRRESPLVIKERFLAMRDQNETKRAISLARIMKGDPDALQFLVSVGLTDDAISQASCSENERGLEQLASDLINLDQPTSFLCAQSHILRAIEKSQQSDTRTSQLLYRDSVNILVDLFLKRWLSTLIGSGSSPSDSPNNPASTANNKSTVPSLSHLSIMAVTREFLAAAMSTSNMQKVLERLEAKILSLDISFFLAVASLAVICGTDSLGRNRPPKGLCYALDRAGLLSHYDNKRSTYSGILTTHYFSRDLLSQELLSQFSYAVLECSKYEDEITLAAGRSQYNYPRLNFSVGLFSSIYAAVHSRSSSIALHHLHVIKRKCDDGYSPPPQEPLPFTSLAMCFSRLVFAGENPHQNTANLQKQILETALSVRVSDSVLDRVLQEQMWVALAYKEHVGVEKAASLLAESIFFNQESAREKNDPRQLYRDSTTVLKYLSLVDTKNGAIFAKYNTMSPFALSSKRTQLSRSERSRMCSVYLCRILALSSSFGPPIHPGWLAKCALINKAVNPSFWNVESDQVDGWLSQQPTGLSSCFSDKLGLHHVCRILYFVDSKLREGEDWSRYFILACGLSWLRAMLLPTELPKFDQVRENFSSNWTFDRFVADEISLFEPDDWAPPEGNDWVKGHFLDGKPVFTTFALIRIVEYYALEIQELFENEGLASNIPHLCHETLVFCRIMRFLLIPSLSNFKKLVEDKRNGRGPDFELPSHLDPDYLLEFVLRDDWGMKGDFSCFDDTPRGDPGKRIPQFIPRLVLALEHGRIKEAAAFCVAQGTTSVSWDLLSESSCSYRAKKFRELLQGCLLTLRVAAMASTDVPKEFINITTHVTLMINWFQCCTRCCWASQIIKHSHELVPSSHNIQALHDAASAWSIALMENNDTQSMANLKRCARMICCLARCRTAFASVLTTRKGCECKIRDDVYGDMYGKSCDQPSDKCSREEILAFDIDADFRELQSFIKQIHLKEPSDWIEYILPRVKTALAK